MSAWTFSAHEKFRPTLVSAILHIATVIVLAAVTIDTVKQRSIDLHVFPQDDLASEELAPVDLVSFNSGQIAVPDASIAELDPVALAPEVGRIVVPSRKLPFSQTLANGSVAAHGDLSQTSAKGRTTFFGLAGEGTKFVYLFDRSNSMTSVFRVYQNGVLLSEISPLALAKAELLKSLEPLSSTDRFQVVFYNESPMLFHDVPGFRGLISASTDTKLQAQQFVADVPGEGGTNHVDAILVAIQLKPDVVFLITDGEAKDDPPLNLVRSLARSCRDKKIQVNIVHFSTQARPKSTLLQLARRTGGKHRFINLNDMSELQ